MTTTTSVLGLGNVLMGDDAAGPWVAELLQARYRFPEAVQVLDAGTPGLDLIPYVTEIDTLIVVDTVLSDAPPGSIRLYRRDALLRHAPQPRLSPHDPSLKEALLTAEFLGQGPRETLLVGIVPQGTATGIGLSPAVQASLEPAAEAVVEELRRLGHEITPRGERSAVRPWWERSPEAQPASSA